MISNLFNITKKSLMINQLKLDTIGQNIANINTEGYSRQRVVVEADDPIDYGGISLGSGVKLTALERVRDLSLDEQFRKENTSLGNYEKTSQRLQELEADFLEPSDNGLSARLNAFWDAWEDVANSSSGSEGVIMRKALAEKTVLLTDEFHRLNEVVVDKKNQIATDISQDVERVNAIASELAELNRKLQLNVYSNTPSNDLEDKFDSLYDELSKYGDTRLIIRQDGMRTIYFGSEELVKHTSVRQLELNSEGTQVVFSGTQNAVNGLKNGEISSLMTLKNNNLEDYQDKLDNLAQTLAKTVNQKHRSGYGLGDSLTTGNDFFADDVTGASDIRIFQPLYDDPNLIAASLTGEEGDNRNALSIARLRDESVLENNTGFSSYYASLLHSLGSATDNATSKYNVYEATTNQIDTFRENIKGVSLDEETAEMMKYQKHYQAAAKLMAMAEEIMDAVIGIVK